MKKLLALTVAVWASATICAGVLAFSLNAPLKLRDAPALRIAPRSAPAMELATPGYLEDRVLIPRAAATVAPRPRAKVMAAPAATARPAPRDISAMRCTGWVELQQGPAGRHVQYCE